MMQKIRLRAINEVGQHARPGSEFEKLAGQFPADLQGIQFNCEGNCQSWNLRIESMNCEGYHKIVI